MRFMHTIHVVSDGWLGRCCCVGFRKGPQRRWKPFSYRRPLRSGARNGTKSLSVRKKHWAAERRHSLGKAKNSLAYGFFHSSHKRETAESPTTRGKSPEHPKGGML